MTIKGIEGLSPDDVRHEIERGARFVIYTYAVSLVVVSFKRSSPVYFVRAGQSRTVKGLPFVLVSALFGWWGIPWGLIYTIQSLVTDLGGGKDVTNDILALSQQGQQPITQHTAPGTFSA